MIGEAHAAEAAKGGEHGAGAFPPFDATLFSHQIIWFAIAFGVLYWLMSRVALPRVGQVIARRKATLAADLDAAAQASAQADAARAAMEKATAEARANARKLVDDMRADVQKSLAQTQADAEARVAAQIASAEARIAEARAKALGEVGAMADDLARAIVGKVTGAQA